MNLQTYAQMYARFHGAYAFQCDTRQFIQIPLYTEFNMRLAFFKMQNLQFFGDNDTALVRALRAYFRCKAPSTLFYDADTWGLLLADKLLVYPQEQGTVTLTATPYFVEDLQTFEDRVLTQAVLSSDHVYVKENAIIYLDAEDVPYPAGVYFHPSRAGKVYRICFLTLTQEPVPDYVLDDKHVVRKRPFFSRETEVCLSPFLRLPEPQAVHFPEHQTTGLIVKNRCKLRASYLLQDILDAYSEGTNVGILIETPIRLSFGPEVQFTDSRGANWGSQPPANRRFHALAVNCVLPEMVLYVPAPYERYYLHQQKRPYDWTTIFYEKTFPLSMSLVWWDGFILGVCYRDTFFCLSHVMLGRNALIRHRNLSKIVHLLSFPLEERPELVVLHSYDVEGGYTLHCVKHRDLKYELWCLEAKKCLSGKRPVLPPLVSEWVALVQWAVPHLGRRFPKMTILRAMAVFTKHNICFQMEESSPPSFNFEKKSTIQFKVTREMKDYINGLRLLRDTKEDTSETCVIM